MPAEFEHRRLINSYMRLCMDEARLSPLSLLCVKHDINIDKGILRCINRVRYSLSTECQSAPCTPPSWTCWEDLPRETPKCHPYEMPEPPQLAPFYTKEQELHSEPIMDG